MTTRGAITAGAYVRALGPGLVTGASDDDPSGVATYAQAGAQFRYGLAGMNLLGAGPTTAWALAAGVIVTVLLIAGSFDVVARALKVLAAALLAYVVVMVVAHPDWVSVAAHTFVPHLEGSRGYVLLSVA